MGNTFYTSSDGVSSNDVINQLVKAQEQFENQFDFIRECYPLITKFMFGDDFANSKDFPCQCLNLDMMRIVLDYCDAKSLINFSKTCKFIRNMMKEDFYYWPQVMRCQNLKQFINYLKENTYYFETDCYTNIAQTVDYSKMEIPRVSFVKNLSIYSKNNGYQHDYKTYFNLSTIEWSTIQKTTKGNGTGILVDSNGRISQIDLINILVQSLFEMRKSLKGKIGERCKLDFIEPNYRCGIRDYRNFLNSHHRLSFLLRVRELEDLENNGPVECENHEEDFVHVPLDEKQVGKPVLYSCNFCKSKVGGFTCLNCNKLFEISSNKSDAICSNCKCTIERPHCCRQMMQISSIDTAISPLQSNPPIFHCKCSKMTCNCFACGGSSGTPLIKTALFRRLKPSGLFKCSNNCTIARYHCERFTCTKCKEFWDLDIER